MTVVALTTATATLPGRSCNSSAASVLINDTTVNGPHCISTWVITLSLTTDVTSPTKRLRAELPMLSGSAGGAGAFVRENWARSSLAITLRPAASRPTVNVPWLIQRRTVSSLTPSSSAAWRIRRLDTTGSYRISRPRLAAPRSRGRFRRD